MSPFYITQGDLALTDTSISTQAIYDDTSMRYDYGYTQTFSTGSNYYDYPTRKKQETVKERHIREGGAFKCFYGKGNYTPINKNRISKAERKEKVERVNKFKGLNENLIIK
ncbi:MAG: hypothetical protein IPJ01_10795 [Micavibrio sp.]|nr:hypothetical protein [Micavibrio sp.]